MNEVSKGNVEVVRELKVPSQDSYLNNCIQGGYGALHEFVHHTVQAIKDRDHTLLVHDTQTGAWPPDERRRHEDERRKTENKKK